MQRKNGKRLKYGYYRVRIPLTDSISVLPVSLPLEKLSFTVSLPLVFFYPHTVGVSLNASHQDHCSWNSSTRYLILLSFIAHAAFTHHQLMQHTRTASSCSIHAPPAHAAFTHRQLMQHSRTASSSSIHTPPAHAAYMHRQLMQH